MLNFKIELTDKNKESLKTLLALIDQPKKCRQIMSLFYSYIEKNDIVNPELKCHAFIYWGDYFSNVMFVFWGSLTLLGATIILIFGGPITVLQIVIILIMVVLIALNLREIFFGKTAQKQFEFYPISPSHMYLN